MKYLVYFICFISLSSHAQNINFETINTNLLDDGSVSYTTALSYIGDTIKLREKVRDINSYESLTDAIAEVIEIEKTKNSLTYYMLYDLPWPLENRQSVSYSKIWHEGGVMMIHTQPLKRSFDYPNDAIIMNKFFEKWEVQQNEDGLIKVFIEGQMNLEGELPSWLLKSFIPNELKTSYTRIIEGTLK